MRESRLHPIATVDSNSDACTRTATLYANRDSTYIFVTVAAPLLRRTVNPLFSHSQKKNAVDQAS